MHYVHRMVKETLNIRMEPEQIDALRREAEKDGHTASSLARKVLADWLKVRAKAERRKSNA
jgi:hypothetical protein